MIFGLNAPKDALGRKIDTTLIPSIAHIGAMNDHRDITWPGGKVTWVAAMAPNFSKGRYVGHERACGYCGSIHPIDFASSLIELGQDAQAHWADWKYGWPHKIYLYIPNIHRGMLESRMSCTHKPKDPENWFKDREGTWRAKGQPAKALAYAKFYTAHLQDATETDRAIIEQAMGFTFTFEGTKVSWKRCES